MNPEINITNLEIRYPIFGFRSKSIKSLILNKSIGGIINIPGNYDNPEIIALNNLNITIKANERVGIVGSNGSGKSTLLRVILGSYPPTKGQINVHGKISSMINLTLGIDDNLTALENIELRLRILGYSNSLIKNSIEDIISFSELESFANLPMRTYSSGMVMRLLFSIATSIKADIVLMDEWLSAGDASFSKKAEQRLNNYLEKASILVIASHNVEMINNLCTRIIKLDHGNIIEDSIMPFKN
jgi:lipopolysaccharide transport system ATP-binding protein